MALAAESLYTIEDIYSLPDGTRAELIDGQIYYMAPPGTIHQRISGFLYSRILRHIEEHDGKCEVFAAPFAVFLNKDKKNYVEPDISVICDENKLDEKGCHGAPDWVIEIVSPSTKNMDYGTKLFKYQAAGVREYWIADPLKKRIMIWRMEQNTVEEYTFSESVKAGIYEDLSIDFSKIRL